MANFYIYDAGGQKRGPYTPAQVKELAAKGSITPQTAMETEAGHKGYAGQISGLFPPAPPLPASSAAMPKPVPPLASPPPPKPENIEIKIQRILHEGETLINEVKAFKERGTVERKQKIAETVKQYAILALIAGGLIGGFILSVLSEIAVKMGPRSLEMVGPFGGIVGLIIGYIVGRHIDEKGASAATGCGAGCLGSIIGTVILIEIGTACGSAGVFLLGGGLTGGICYGISQNICKKIAATRHPPEMQYKNPSKR
jgi:hypothetical protein